MTARFAVLVRKSRIWHQLASEGLALCGQSGTARRTATTRPARICIRCAWAAVERAA